MTKPKEHLIYVGRRLIEGKALQHCFVLASKIEMLIWYPKARKARFRGCIIGTEYDVTDGLPVIWSKAETGFKYHNDNCLEHEISDRMAEMEQRQKRVKQSPELDGIIENLRYHRARLSPVQKAGFDAWLLSKLR